MTSELVYDVAEGILAKQSLAEMHPHSHAWRTSSVNAFESSGYVLGTVVFLPVASAIHVWSPSFADCAASFLPEPYPQSDSQQESRQSQLAKGARTVNDQAKQAEEYIARVFTFERPFPRDESSYLVESRDVSKVAKLRKRT